MRTNKFLFATLAVLLMCFLSSANPAPAATTSELSPEEKLKVSMDSFILVKEDVKSKLIANYKN